MIKNVKLFNRVKKSSVKKYVVRQEKQVTSTIIVLIVLNQELSLYVVLINCPLFVDISTITALAKDATFHAFKSKF